jgi:guanine nucleotide-binding protein G(i) subunit alpha
MIKHARDDTSSLYVQLGSASIHSGRSRCTDTLSKISRCFEFDRELFSSKVYEKVLRNSLKDTVDALRRQASPGLRTGHTKKTTDSGEDASETVRLQSIDRKLESKRSQEARAKRIVLLGDYDCAQAFVNETKILHPDGFTTEELQNYKSMIRDNISRITQAVEFIIEGTTVDVDNTTRELALRLCHKLRNGRSNDATFSRTAAEALQEGRATKKLCKIIMQSGQPGILIFVE